MNDKQIAVRAEDLTAQADRANTEALGAELNNMSVSDRASVLKQMDEMKAAGNTKQVDLPDLDLWGDDAVPATPKVESYTDSNGVTTTTDEDGRVLVEYPDGTLIFRDVNGKVLRIDPDDTKTEVWKDGSYRIKHPNGKIERGIFC